jgi:hypothetical protein
MFTHTPGWFHDVATEIMIGLRFDFDQINVGNVWNIFSHMLPHIRQHFVENFYRTPSPDPFNRTSTAESKSVEK